jgi:hypothetical protein
VVIQAAVARAGAAEAEVQVAALAAAEDPAAEEDPAAAAEAVVAAPAVVVTTNELALREADVMAIA